MNRLVLLDSEPLGLATNPRDSAQAARCKAWLRGLLVAQVRVMVPEVIDYEVRRELIRAGRFRGIDALNSLGTRLGQLPCSGAVLIEAAGLWAEARRKDQPTAEDKALDIDVILAATANLAAGEGYDVVIATGNVGHLSRYTIAEFWVVSVRGCMRVCLGGILGFDPQVSPSSPNPPRPCRPKTCPASAA